MKCILLLFAVAASTALTAAPAAAVSVREYGVTVSNCQSSLTLTSTPPFVEVSITWDIDFFCRDAAPTAARVNGQLRTGVLVPNEYALPTVQVLTAEGSTLGVGGEGLIMFHDEAIDDSLEALFPSDAQHRWIGFSSKGEYAESAGADTIMGVFHYLFRTQYVSGSEPSVIPSATVWVSDNGRADGITIDDGVAATGPTPVTANSVPGVTPAALAAGAILIALAGGFAARRRMRVIRA